MKKTLLFKSIALSLFMLFSIGILNAQVFITELADPNNESGARFVELFNSGSTDIDLSTGWQLQRATNGNDYYQDPVDLTGTIMAGGFYIVCANQTTFTSTYGFAADQSIGTGGAADSNGDDQLRLLSPGSVVEDMFGVLAEDGSETNHEFEDGRAERKATVTAANATYTFSEWNIWNDTGSAETTNDPQNAPDDFDPGEWIGNVTLATDLFFSEYIEGNANGNNRAIEIFNGTGADVDLSAYTVKQSHSSTGWGIDGIMYVLPLSGTIVDGDVYIIANIGADAEILAEADTTFDYGDDQGHKIPFFTGDDALALFKSDVLIDVIGIELEADGDGPWAVAGIADATQDHTLVRKGTVIEGNTDWTAAAGTDADDSEWIVLASDVTSFLGDHYLGEAPVETTYTITFNVDMSLVASFDASSDVVYVEGTINGWAGPGSNADLIMTDADGNMTYTVDYEMDIPGGDIEYKFFINTGWDGGEWDGGANRAATITETTTLSHIFANQGEAIFFDAPFVQNFDYTTANANASLAGWTNANLTDGGALLWSAKDYSDNKYVQISSYSSTSTSFDEAWLITPGINMDNSTGEELSFDVNVGYWKHDGLTVQISTDFDQTVAGILTATWTDVTADFTIPSEPAGSYGIFATAGHLDVSSYTGTMYVAFVYNGDDAAGQTTTYQIDNVVIAEAGTVGIDDVVAVELNIYPNPSNGKFYIEMGDTFKVNTKIEVFNVVGMKVLETITNDFKTEIDLSAMKQGIYYVRVNDGQNIVTQKVMKQ